MILSPTSCLNLKQYYYGGRERQLFRWRFMVLPAVVSALLSQQNEQLNWVVILQKCINYYRDKPIEPSREGAEKRLLWELAES